MIVVGTLLALLLAAPASAQINNPPQNHELVLFPKRDMVEGAGYTPGEEILVRVVRGGFVIGESHATADSTGTILINHPAEPGEDVVNCWENVTPNIRAYDVVQFLDNPSGPDGEASTVADVTAGPAILEGDDIVIHGTARDAAGNPLPLDSLEQRLINPALFDNGTRRLQAPGDGILLYDAPGSINWTATYEGLSDADKNDALRAQSRILKLGDFTPPGLEGPSDITIYEEDEVDGPGDPCTAPSATPATPSRPDLFVGHDTGASNTDDITRFFSRIAFQGLAPRGSTVKIFVDGIQNGSGLASASGRYSVYATNLTNGNHMVTAQAVSSLGDVSPVSLGLAITIDSIRPTVTTSQNSYMSPNGDGRLDVLNASATFSESAAWSFQVLSGDLLTVLASSAGSGLSMAASWNGMAGSPPAVVADGLYKWRVSATDVAGNVRTLVRSIVVDTTAPTVSASASPNPFDPSAGSTTISFSSSEAALVSVQIKNADGRLIRTFSSVRLTGAGGSSVAWDGTKSGVRVPDGTYSVFVKATDSASNVGNATTSVDVATAPAP